MGKRQEAALETKKKLLKATEELLKEKDMNDVNIEEITKRAGVAKGSFYTYFRNKEDAIACSALDKYDSVRQKALNEDEGVYENLCTYLKGSVKIIHKYSLQTAQGWMMSVTNPVEGDCKGTSKYTFDFDNILSVLTKAVERKELKKDMPAEKVTGIIMNAYYGAVAVWCLSSGKEDLIKRMNEFCECGLKAIIDAYKEEK